MKAGYVKKGLCDYPIEKQTTALRKESVSIIFTEEFDEEKQLGQMMKLLQGGDELFVYQLSCLGKTIKQLEDYLNELKKRDIRFFSVKDQIQVITYEESAFIQNLNLLAENESKLKSALTTIGIKEAKSNGKHIGRPALTNEKIEQIRILYLQGKSFRMISSECSLSLGVIHKYINQFKMENQKASCE